jgi:hypothetical protein
MTVLDTWTVVHMTAGTVDSKYIYIYIYRIVGFVLSFICGYCVYRPFAILLSCVEVIFCGFLDSCCYVLNTSWLFCCSVWVGYTKSYFIAYVTVPDIFLVTKFPMYCRCDVSQLCVGKSYVCLFRGRCLARGVHVTENCYKLQQIRLKDSNTFNTIVVWVAALPELSINPCIHSICGYYY